MIIMLSTLVNDLSTTDFLLLVLVAISFMRLVIDLLKFFHPAQIFLKSRDRYRKD